MLSFESYFHPAIGINYDGDRVAIQKRLVKGVLALVNPLFLVLDSLATPRVAQTVGSGSNGQGVYHRNICHAVASLAQRTYESARNGFAAILQRPKLTVIKELSWESLLP